MNAPETRLDRLSALLDGLSPAIAVAHAGPLTGTLDCAGETRGDLVLHLLLSGALRYGDADGERLLSAPAAAIVQRRRSHTLQPTTAAGATLLSARIDFAGPAGASLLAAFARPTTLALHGVGDDLGHLLALIDTELRSPRCGHRSLLAHAVEMLLITLLRHLIARPDGNSGMLSGLADARIARAVVAMNENVAAPWRLESLAETAGMSRTAFAATFRARMGVTPGSYLAGLRLAIAEQAIGAGSGLKRAAQAAGYASPAALSRALARRRRLATNTAAA